MFGAVASLDFAVRGGRVSPRLARTLKPPAPRADHRLDEHGKPGQGGAALGFDRALNTIVKRVVRFAATRPPARWSSTAATRRARTSSPPAWRTTSACEVPVVRAGAVLTTHVGLGCVTAAVRRVTD